MCNHEKKFLHRNMKVEMLPIGRDADSECVNIKKMTLIREISFCAN